MRKRTYMLTPQRMLTIMVWWWFVWALLAVNGWTLGGVLWLVGAPLMLVLPGALTLTLASVQIADGTARLSMWLLVSLLELIVLGLVQNTVLPMFGVVRPLDTVSVVWSVTVLVLLLFFMAWPRLGTYKIEVALPTGCMTLVSVLHLVLPPLLAVSGALGALLLNVSNESWLTLTFLVVAAVYMGVLYRVADTLPRYIAPYALFFLGLGLLLMTSLRGWYISGHDIQREFYVFQLARDAGVWSMAAYRDAYNACLSITILPTMLANVLHVADAYVYKALYQVIFAFAGVLAYLISRRWLSVRLSLLSGLLLISFPTFFQDMPYLVRQEVAFLFYGGLIYALFARGFSDRARQALVVAFGVGVVLSHYSTTYTVLFTLVLAVLGMPLFFKVLRLLHTRHVLPDSALMRDLAARGRTRVVRFLPVVLIVIVALLWTSVITDTDGHLKSVIQETWSAIVGGTEDTERSVDVLFLFSFGRPEVEHTLDEYIEEFVEPRRMEAPEQFYATSTYANYPQVTLGRIELPTTPLGSVGREYGLMLKDVVTYVGRLLAKIMQGAIVLGLLYVLFSRRWPRRIDAEYYVLAVLTIFFVLLCIVVPMLSIEYGLFRALQQSMFILAPFLVLGLLLVGQGFAWLVERWLRLVRVPGDSQMRQEGYTYGVAGTLTILFMLYATGVMTHLVGGNLPPAHLYNVGDDYRHYIVEPGEYEAIQWIKEEQRRTFEETGYYATVQTDRFMHKKLSAYMTEGISYHVYPGVVQRDAYVVVSPAMRFSQSAGMVYHEGVNIKYAYPLSFLDEVKDVVFDNGTVVIYR